MHDMHALPLSDSERHSLPARFGQDPQVGIEKLREHRGTAKIEEGHRPSRSDAVKTRLRVEDEIALHLQGFYETVHGRLVEIRAATEFGQAQAATPPAELAEDRKPPRQGLHRRPPAQLRNTLRFVVLHGCADSDRLLRRRSALFRALRCRSVRRHCIEGPQTGWLRYARHHLRIIDKRPARASRVSRHPAAAASSQCARSRRRLRRPRRTRSNGRGAGSLREPGAPSDQLQLDELDEDRVLDQGFVRTVRLHLGVHRTTSASAGRPGRAERAVGERHTAVAPAGSCFDRDRPL